MVIRFEFTPALLIANENIVRRKLLLTVRVIAIVVTIFGALVLTAGLVVGRSFGEILRTQWVLIFTGPLWLVGFPALRHWQLKRWSSASPVWQGQHVYTIEPSGIQFVTPASKTETGWSTISRVLETKDLVQLYAGNYIAYPIPKSALTTPGAMDELKRIVNQAGVARADWMR